MRNLRYNKPMSSARRTKSKERCHLLDVIRGITLISMIIYHGAWDMVYIAGHDWPFYHTHGAFVWQQSICWTFILLSGFCMNLSVHKWRRGILVSVCGLLVTTVTLVFLPEDRVIYGVLTFIGAAMLITALFYEELKRIPAAVGILVNGYLFFLFRFVNSGYLQFWKGVHVSLPSSWYHGYFFTFLGFMDPSFYSTDYFSLLPWLFLFWAGLFLGKLFAIGEKRAAGILYFNIPPLSFLGRHSLLIYLLHQPVLYMFFVLGSRMAGH